MTHRSSPRSPRPSTPDAPSRASPAPADGGYWNPDYNPRADDPLAWENYLPGGSFYREGDPVPPTTAEIVARLVGDGSDSGSGDGDGSACEDAADAGGAGASEGEVAGWIPDHPERSRTDRNDNDGDGGASGVSEGAEDKATFCDRADSDAGSHDGSVPDDAAPDAAASDDASANSDPDSANSARRGAKGPPYPLPIFHPTVDIPALLALVPPAAPAPGRRRSREWTGERRVAFLTMLSATQSPAAAARSVGMSRSGAYALRARMAGSAFVRAWDMAMTFGFDALAHAALDRAMNGVEVPHYYKGEMVGTSRRYDERLTLALLSQRGHLARPSAVPAAEPGEWALILHSVLDEAEDEIEAIAAQAAEDARAKGGTEGVD